MLDPLDWTFRARSTAKRGDPLAREAKEDRDREDDDKDDKDDGDDGPRPSASAVVVSFFPFLRFRPAPRFVPSV